jgi:hypothetical protein
MAERLWTAEEFERLTPAEQDAVFEASIECDLSRFPTDFVNRVRARTRTRIADSESDRQ